MTVAVLTEDSSRGDMTEAAAAAARWPTVARRGHWLDCTSTSPPHFLPGWTVQLAGRTFTPTATKTAQSVNDVYVAVSGSCRTSEQQTADYDRLTASVDQLWLWCGAAVLTDQIWYVLIWDTAHSWLLAGTFTFIDHNVSVTTRQGWTLM